MIDLPHDLNKRLERHARCIEHAHAESQPIVGTVCVRAHNVVYQDDIDKLEGEYRGETVKTGDVVKDERGNLYKVFVVGVAGSIITEIGTVEFS